MKKEDVFETLVTKLLEFHKLTREKLVGDQDWFHRYTWTSTEQEEFRTWAVELLRKKKRFTKEKANKEMSWFLLAYGYRIKD